MRPDACAESALPTHTPHIPCGTPQVPGATAPGCVGRAPSARLQTLVIALLAALFAAAPLQVHAAVRGRPSSIEALQSAVTARPEQQTPLYTPTNCDTLLTPETDNPLNLLLPAADERMRCGYITVPETHGADDGRTIRIAVVVLGAMEDKPSAAPLFIMQGGPGGGTIDTYQTMLRSHSLRGTRDIVLFDQRGTGRSQPKLLCTESYDLAVRTAEQFMTYTESVQASETAISACRTRLHGEGVNLDAFDSIENARDIDDVRRALGYDKIDLYGVSYGTQLAQHAMREIPQALRTVILDGVAPLADAFLVDVARSEDRALTEFFSACTADAVCAADYPNLERTYFDTAATLDRAPLRMHVDDPNSGRSYSMFLDGVSLQALVFQALYSKEMLPLLPKLIDDVHHGRTDFAGTIAGMFAFENSTARAMYFSVICSEDIDPQTTTPDLSGLRPEIAETAAQDLDSIKRICRSWNVKALPAVANAPVVSDIPTLLLSGHFDPITPPENGDEVAASLTHAYTFTFPNTAHGAFPVDPCASSIVQAFLADPEQRPNDACMRGAEPLSFVGRDDLIDVTVLGRMLTAPSSALQWELLALAAALVTLLSGLVLMPLGWLARLVLRGSRPKPTLPFGAKLMPWAAALQALLTTIFTFGLIGVGFSAAAEGSYTFLIGVTRSAQLLFTLPPVIALLTIVATWGVVAGWRSGAWGFLRRAYRTLLLLAMIVSVVVLVRWDVILRL